MSDLLVDEWDPALFQNIETLLVRVTSSQVNKSSINHLYRLLDKASPWLECLTQFPTPGAEERQNTEKNPITLPSGTAWHVNDNLLAEATELSTSLSISTRLAAVLIIHADQNRHLYPERDRKDIGLFLLYDWTSKMLDILHELLRLTIGPDAEVGEPFDELRMRVEGLLNSRLKVGASGGEGTLVDLILSQLDELQKKLGTLVGTQRSVGMEFDTLMFKVSSVRSQQGKLVEILGMVAQGGALGRGQTVKLLKWLKKCDRPDGLTTGALSIFLYVVETEFHLENDVRRELYEEWTKDIQFLKVVTDIVFTDNWALPQLKEAARLAWCLYLLPAVQRNGDIPADYINGNLSDAINNEVFLHLRHMIRQRREERGLEPIDETQEAAKDILVKLATRTPKENDEFVFARFETVVDTLARKRNFLRNLRNKEEDHSMRKSQTSLPPRHFTAFQELAAMVYRSAPVDSACLLWEDPQFTSAILDLRGRTSDTTWDLLVAIATGPESARRAIDVIGETIFSFNQLMEMFKHYASYVPKLYESMKSTRAPPEKARWEENDAKRALGLTRLWTTIIKSLPMFKSVLLQQKPLEKLFDMMNLEVPLEIKVAVMDAITAFCVTSGEDSDTAIWQEAVESLKRITYDNPVDPRSTDRPPIPVGWLNSLLRANEAEVYPLSRAYIRFLNALLPGARRSDVIAVALRRETDFVFKRLATIQQQLFRRESERWETFDEELAFVEKSLLDLDLTDLQPSRTQSSASVAWKLFALPGFVVLMKLLDNTDIKLFDLLGAAVDAIPNLARTVIHDNVLSRILRIYYRVLDIQAVVSQILLPALDLPHPSRFPFRRPANLQPLDLRLLNRLSNVTNIALLVNDEDLSISLLSTKIIAALAGSPHFNQVDRFGGEYTRTINRLAGLIDASDESIRIAQGFCNRLGGEAADVAPETADTIEKETLRGEISAENLSALPLVIRSNILDILLEGTASDALGPNIAHFLLGFEFKGHNFALQNPNEADSRFSCLQVVLQQLRGDDEDESTDPNADDNFVNIHPTLAAKSARLIHQLFSHPVTGRASMSYAMSTENFSATQLRILSQQIPISQGVGQGIVTSPIQQTETSANSLVAYLEFQRWIVSSVALETHAFEGKAASVETVASILFGSSTEEESRPLIIDMLVNIDLEWKENVDESKSLEIFAGFNFNQFKQGQADYWDIEGVRRALSLHAQQMKDKDPKVVQEELEYLVHLLSASNRATEIELAKGTLLSAWAEVLKVALGRLFIQYVPEERQEIVLFELLDALLSRMDQDISQGVLDILAESVCVAMSTLQSILSTFDGVNLPIEILGQLLIKIINAVTRPGTTENARGNLYAAISQYLSLLSTPTNFSDEASVAPSTIGRDIPGFSLQRETIRALGVRKDRFLAVLSRDAMDVRDVWKTECFALLGGLVGACASERDRQVLSPLLKEGYLPLFVRSIKDREIALQECLSPEAENLHAYWVFEAKIAFLLNVATTRKGAEDLLDAGVFEIFSMCGFIAAQPYAEDTPEQHEAISRQHRVLICVLQLLSRTLASLHRSSRSGAGHALSFLNAHRDSVVLLLRETQQNPSAVGIEESQLIIAILAMVIHKVPAEDRKNIASFGAYHLAILSLSARFFDPYWSEGIEEEEKASLDKKVLAFNQVVLAYLCASTAGLKAGAGYPVFLNGSQIASGGAQNISTTPTLQLVGQLLDGLVEQLEDLSTEYEEMSERVQHGSELSDAEMAKLSKLDWEDPAISPETVHLAYVTRNRKLQNMTESVLLLLWRHLLFFANSANSDPIRPDNLSISLVGSQAGAGQMRALKNVAADLRGTLQRLSDVSVPEELKRGGERSEAYFGMLVRRLGELTAGLVGETMAT